MQASFVVGRLRGERAGAWVKWAVLALTGCAQGWEKPRPVDEGAAPVGTVSEALGSTTQGVYVVTKSGLADSYCDGTLYSGNDAGAIQACITKANADGGGRVLVRAGTYSTGSWPIAVWSNVTLAGEGRLATKFAPTSSTEIIYTTQDNSAIENIVFDSSNVGIGAVLLGLSDGPHSNLRFENNQFLLINQGSGTHYGIFATQGPNAYSGIVIRGNTFRLSGTTASNLYGVFFQAVGGTGTMDGVRVEGNDFVLGTALLQSTAAQLLTITSTTPSRGIIFNNNTLRSDVGTLWNFGLYMHGAVDAQVTGNTIPASQTPVAIYQGAAGAPCGATVTGNNFRGGVPPTVDTPCIASSVVTGNTIGSPNIAIGKAAVLVRYWRLGSLTFTPNTDTTVLFNTQDVDNSQSYNPSTGTFTAPVAGTYRVHACVRVLASGFAAGDTTDISVKVNGTAWGVNRMVPAGTTGFSNCVDDLVVLPSGGALTIAVNSTGTATSHTLVCASKGMTYFTVEHVSD